MSVGKNHIDDYCLLGAHGERTVEHVSAKRPYRKPREPREPDTRRYRGWGKLGEEERKICKEEQEMAECRAEGNAIPLLNLALA